MDTKSLPSDIPDLTLGAVLQHKLQREEAPVIDPYVEAQSLGLTQKPDGRWGSLALDRSWDTLEAAVAAVRGRNLPLPSDPTKAFHLTEQEALALYAAAMSAGAVNKRWGHPEDPDMLTARKKLLEGLNFPEELDDLMAALGVRVTGVKPKK